MKLFIWNRVAPVSGNFHQEGGLVVFAHTLDAARTTAASWIGTGVLLDWEENESSSDAPDWRNVDPDLTVTVTDLPDDADRVIVHPDAGCCQ